MAAANSSPRPGPLAGVRVLELGHNIMGPACGLILADLGADIHTGITRRVTRAFEMVASTLARLRMMPASFMSRSTSRSSKSATASMSKSRNAARNVGRRRRMVIHDSPAWKPSRLIFSNSARSPCSGRPHSSS